MYVKILQTFATHILVVVLAFEDVFYVNGHINNEIIERGREKYQLLKERSTLPKYGPCWKSAVEHLDEGCRYLSEDTQSDIALHITNCFLEMSGHETYNCELDKKPNLRAICINSMSDRAFNVYTEFYTHTQNICWFLRGQIWHETIAENTVKVGRQLEVTAENQEGLLKAQKESLVLQEKMLKHGKFLEQVLEDLYISSKAHQDILKVMSQTVASLQAWIVGEVSWIDSVIFYGMAILITFVITSSQRTVSARLPIFLMLFLNLVVERFICSLIISNNDDMDTHNLYSHIYNFIWYSRYAFVLVSTFLLIYRAVIHRDLNAENNEILRNIQEQNNDVLSILQTLKTVLIPNKDNINVINESLNRKSLDRELDSSDRTNSENSSLRNSCESKYRVYKYNSYSTMSKFFKDYEENGSESSKENHLNNSRENKVFHELQNSTYSSRSRLGTFLPNDFQNSRYNLRSRHGTPDITH